MKKLKATSVVIPVLIGICCLGLIPVHPGIYVVPNQYDFEEVEVGNSASTQIEIGNSWWGNLSIQSVELLQAGGDFILVNPPPPGTIVPPGSSLFFGIEFSPSAEGLLSAMIEIVWANGESGTSYVELSGTGIASQATPPSVEDILSFFDSSVADGSLVGAGPGKSGMHRINALRNMLLEAHYLLTEGYVEDACDQLHSACKRCDDFVQGTAQYGLKMMILDLMEELGCV